MIPRVLNWSGVSCDLSITAIQEGIRQYEEYFIELPLYIILKENDYNLIKEYCHSDIKIPLVWRSSEILHENCFILLGKSGLFLSSDPIK